MNASSESAVLLQPCHYQFGIGLNTMWTKENNICGLRGPTRFGEGNGGLVQPEAGHGGDLLTEAEHGVFNQPDVKSWTSRMTCTAYGWSRKT